MTLQAALSHPLVLLDLADVGRAPNGPVGDRNDRDLGEEGDGLPVRCRGTVHQAM